MYNSSNSYYNRYPFDYNNNDVQHFHRQRNSSAMPINFSHNRNDGVYDHIHSLNHTTQGKDNHLYTNENFDKSRNTNYRQNERYDSNTKLENNYTPNNMRRKASQQLALRANSEQDSEMSYQYSEEFDNSKKSARMSSLNGTNIVHISCNPDRKEENEKTIKIRKNKRENKIQSWSDDENETIKTNYTPKNENYGDINDDSYNDKNTYINIYISGNTESRDSYESEAENDETDGEAYDDQMSQNYNNQIKQKRIRKVFMGKYFLSDLKKNLLKPFHLCGPHPTLFVPNPNIMCYGNYPKNKERNRKPEIIVRY